MPEATPAEGASFEDIELAREALLEITPADTIGAPAGFADEGDGVVSVYFEADMVGYPGWRWTASIAHVDGSEPTVLETELMPGDGSMLAPDWVPWVDRLADYNAGQDAVGPDAANSEDSDSDSDSDSDDDDDDDEDDDEDDDDEDDDDDDEDDDDDGRDILHAGDLDGVDIDDVDIDSLGKTADEAITVDESAAPVIGVDESDESESDTDGAGEQPPTVAGVDERREKNK